MDFGLSPEQRMLRDAVDRLLREHCPLDHVREVAEGGDAVSAAVVAALAELGLSGIMVPEEHGGLGLGLLDASVVAEALGAAVAPVPFVARCVLAPLALRLAGTPAQQARWLPRIADGSARFGVGLTEVVNCRDGGGVTAADGTLSGSALFVLDSADADAFVIADQRGQLHLVAGEAEGLERLPLSTIDLTRSVGELRLDGVAAEPLGDDDGGAARRLVAAGRVLLAADSVGAGDAMAKMIHGLKDEGFHYASTNAPSIGHAEMPLRDRGGVHLYRLRKGKNYVELEDRRATQRVLEYQKAILALRIEVEEKAVELSEFRKAHPDMDWK